MSTESRICPLYPNATAPRAAQYALAWGLLLGHLPNVRPDERAHAKCWLTYRAADGEVPLKDWRDKIQPVPVETEAMAPEMQTRWDVSLTMAELCLALLNGDDHWRVKAKLICDRATAGQALLEWPPCLLNYVRTMALLAYAAWLADDETTAGRLVDTAWKDWTQAMARLPWGLYPHRAMEAMDDLRALQALSFVGQKAGVIQPQTTEWCTPASLVTADVVKVVPWARCLARLSQSANPERVIFPGRPVARPRREAVALNCHLTAEQRAYWNMVTITQVTRVPMALGITNRGDDVQTLAALRFVGLPKTAAAIVPRDHPEQWPANETVLLCGWYGIDPVPADDVRVIVAGIHIHPGSVETLAREGAFERLKERVKAQGFPAGARDLFTKRLFEQHGIPVVFSGCVSLTLSMAERSGPPSRRLLVDAPVPAGENAGSWELMTHRHAELANMTADERILLAGQRLHDLAHAAEIVTGRLHVALPALALGCPSVRVYADDLTSNPERWEGYLPEK